MRSHVVTHYRTFKPEWQKQTKEADKKVTLLWEKAKVYYDQRAHPLGKLDSGRIVRVLSPSTGARLPKLLAKMNVGGATSSNFKGKSVLAKSSVPACIFWFMIHMEPVLKLNLVFSYSCCVQTVTVVPATVLERACGNMHSQLCLPTCTHTCPRRHLYLHSRTQTSGCIKGPPFSLPVVFVAFCLQ